MEHSPFNQFDQTNEVPQLKRSEPKATKLAWLDRYSLATKLRVSIASGGVVLIAVTLIIFASVTLVSGKGERLADLGWIEIQVASAVIALDEADRALSSESQGREEKYEQAVDFAISEMNQMRTLVDGRLTAEETAYADRFDASLAALKQKAVIASSSAAEIASLRRELASTRAAMNAYRLHIGDLTEPLFKEVFGAITLVIIVSALLILCAVVFSFVSARVMISNVVGTVNSIKNAMDRLANGNTATVIPGLDRSDEIGEMARSLAVFREASVKLREMDEKELLVQKQMVEQSHNLRVDNSKLLERLADGFEVSVGEMIAAVGTSSQEIQSTSATMSNVADQSAAQSKAASKAMEATKENVTAAAAATDEFALSITEISNQASASAELARESRELVDTAHSRIGDLSNAALEVGDIAELIRAIAERTNLLALNASIEAARGGDQGHGFAVVASEVKELAAQTSQATESVTHRIGTMQATTKLSVGDLSRIVQQIEKLEKAATVIASAVDQQSVSGSELARNIDTVAHGTSQVSEEIQILYKASQTTDEASNDVLDSAKRLDEYSASLTEQARQFISEVRRSSLELRETDAKSVMSKPGSSA